MILQSILGIGKETFWPHYPICHLLSFIGKFAHINKTQEIL